MSAYWRGLAKARWRDIEARHPQTRQIDPLWWTSGVIDGEPIGDVLARRDITKIFRFMNARGWSRFDIASATGLTEAADR